MDLNQSVHWSLLDHEIMPEKGSNRICTWIVWCQIIHLSWFTKTKSCTFYQTQIAEATTYSANTVKAALTLLLDKGMIRCIKPYQRKGSKAGIYGLTPASIRIAQKLYQKQSSAVSASDRVNNVNYDNRVDDINISPPIKKMVTSTDLTDSEYFQQQLKNKNK